MIGIMEIFKKPGLVDEALGELVDLTYIVDYVLAKHSF
jgi:hypothetical protein